MKLYILTVTVLAALSEASAATQKQAYNNPTAILKQIDKHNEDGSYTYGYEDADGTYKIETKYPDGEVYGKYGYIDDTGALREVEYGASRRGFEPTGNEIQVPPPTLKVNENAIARPLAPNEIDDGQYREDPAVYYQDETYNNQQQPRSGYQQRPASRYQSYQEPAYETAEPANDFEIEAFKPSYKPQTYRPAAQYRPQSSYTQADYRPQPAFRPQQPQPVYRPQSAYRPEPEEYYEQQPQYRPEPPRYRPQPSYPKSNFGFSNSGNNYNPPPPPPPPPPQQPAYNNYNNYNNNNNNLNGPVWTGHPATNFDIWSGSYSVNYKR